MSKLISALTLVIFSQFASATTITPSPVDHLFIPSGFDNNDNVEMIVTGKFPSNCYSRNKVESKIIDDLIDVTVTSLVRPTQKCDITNIPFTENITLGTLQGGTYKVKVNGKEMGALKVAEATSNSVDDHLYARVDYVELGFTGGVNGEAFLVGKTAIRCVELDRVEYISNGKDTISILPIMKKTKHECDDDKTYLEIPIKFDLSQFKHSKTMLFVRTMDGKSVNGIVER